ncbi:MAG: PEGA domain-containing protein [Candidatus Andersenbacteria bacterium]|nr:PEGA domain-containing protein [Candidatus Andersenbacteria bacterium]MBI3250327.1 PEGA domain-containing protein [Candidatus Andersenbacteria bacterium]
MNRVIRRLLLIGACVFFALAAPAIILYAIGYRFQLQSQPRQVGVLLIETIPQDAVIEIDGTQVGTSPEAVSNLPEGTTAVRIVKDGYVPWEKHIPIEPARAVELRTVRLFPENTLARSIAADITAFSLSPSRRLIAATDSQQRLHILDQTGESVADPLTLQGTSQHLLWSSDSTALIVEYTTGNRELVHVADLGLTREALPSLATAGSFVWDPRLPGRLLALTTNGSLRSYSTATKAFTNIAEGVNLFALTRRQIVVSNENGALQWYSLTGDLQHEQAFPELGEITRIVAAPTGLVAVQNTNGNLFVLVQQEVLPVADSGEIVGFSPSGQVLLVRKGPSELAVFNAADERATYLPYRSLHTILHLSRPIRDPQWFAGSMHIVFQADDEIIISEIDTRDAPRQYSLDSTNTGDARASVGEAGREMFYLKRTGDNTALYLKDLLLEEDK